MDIETACRFKLPVVFMIYQNGNIDKWVRTWVDHAENPNDFIPGIRHALGVCKAQCPIGSRPIADQKGESRIAGTLFPFAIRPMEAWSPRGGGYQQLSALGL
jgi:hypothetical protein